MSAAPPLNDFLSSNDLPRIFVAVQDEHFIIVDKPAGLPSAPLKAHSAGSESVTAPAVLPVKTSEPAQQDAFSQAALLFPEITSVCGKKSIEGGLLHRLDTATRGLLLIARTQNAYNTFECMQKKGSFVKYYCAYCYCPSTNSLKRIKVPAVIESRFRPFGTGSRAVKPVFANASKADLKKAGSKTYRTEILYIEHAAQNPVAAAIKKPDSAQSGAGGNVVCVLCRITAGFRHQVRAHLASCGLPVIGDELYNSFCVQHSGKNTDMHFYACALEFNHPVSGQPVFFCLKEFKDIVCTSCAKSLTPICI